MSEFIFYKEVHRSDIIFKYIIYFFGILFCLFMFFAVYELAKEGLPALKHTGIKFLWSRVWDPVFNEYGALPILYGNFYVAIISLFIASPLSILCSIFITEFLNPKIRRVLIGLINILATIPSVIYGLWGMYVLTPVITDYIAPFLSNYFGFLPFFKGPYLGVGILNASAVVAVMIIPILIGFLVNVFELVPFIFKEQLYALGATRTEVILKVLLPISKSSIIAAIFLAFGRAFGETMAVTMLIGNSFSISLSLLQPSSTIASTIANEYTEAVNSLHLSALNLLALMLLIVSSLMFTMFLFLAKEVRWIKMRS
ncbi:MAG: phosphate ABC transporter permease subunit PstC [Planctomycetota bacterium]